MNELDKKGKFAGILAELIDVIAAGYKQELKMQPAEAKRAAEMAIENIKTHAGGTAIYFSKGHIWAVSEVHRRIYRQFTGANHAELAKAFGLTERQIYNIIASVGREEFDRRQLKLFGTAA